MRSDGHWVSASAASATGKHIMRRLVSLSNMLTCALTGYLQIMILPRLAAAPDLILCIPAM